MFRKQKLFVMAFFVLLVVLIFSSFTWLLNIINSRFSYLPSVYHVYLPTFWHGNKKEVEETKDQKIYRGNIRGVIQKLNYIKYLNVDYLYLSPFMQSPQKDNGYDVADFYNVDNLFGVNSDFQQLLKRAHEKDLKILIDLVMNHTSKNHPWFQWAIGKPVVYNEGPKKTTDENDIKGETFWIVRNEIINEQEYNNVVHFSYDLKKFYGSDIPKSGFAPSENKQQKYQDYYWFRDSIDKESPFYNDRGLNEARGVPWKKISVNYYNEKKIKWYLHTFSDFQPDLNWNNPNVRKEMEEIANFYIKGEDWLKGEKINGIRFDAVTLISKNEKNHLTEVDLNRWHNFLVPFKKHTWKKNYSGYFLTIGELAQSKIDHNSKKIVRAGKEIFETFYLPINNMYVFNREVADKKYQEEALTGRGHFPYAVLPMNHHFSRFLEEHYAVNDYMKMLKFPPALLMENHDHARSVSRFSNCEKDNRLIYGNVPADFKLSCLDEVSNSEIKYNVLPRAKALALFKFLQQGLIILFNGQEISMNNNPKYTSSTYRNPLRLSSIDLQSNWYVTSMISAGIKMREFYFQSTASVGRDNTRTPFQWSGKNNAGWGENSVFWDSNNEPTAKDINRTSLKYFTKNYFRGFVNKKKGRKWNDFLTDLEDSREKFNSEEISKITESYENYSDLDNFLNESNLEKPNQRGFLIFDRSTSINPLFLNPYYKDINVEDQEKDLNSPLNFYRRLLDIRKHNSILQQGNFKELKNDKDFIVNNSNNQNSQMVAAYTRGGKYLIIINLDFIPYQVKINLGKNLKKRILLNTHKKIEYNENNHFLNLEPYQGIVVELI